jgi:hypothetical protein
MWGCLHVLDMQDIILFDHFNYQNLAGLFSAVPTWMQIVL